MQFQSAIDKERRDVEERVSPYVPEGIVVSPLTAARCLVGHIDQFRAMWDAQGHEAAIRWAAGTAINTYITQYCCQVMKYFGPGAGPLSGLGPDVLLQLVMAMTESMPKELLAKSPAAFRWLVQQSLPRLQNLRKGLVVSTIEELGKLVRLCDERLFMLDLADSDDDEWVYDNVEILEMETKGHGLLGTVFQIAAAAWPVIYTASEGVHNEREYAPGPGNKPSAVSCNNELALAA